MSNIWDDMWDEEESEWDDEDRDDPFGLSLFDDDDPWQPPYNPLFEDEDELW